MAKTREYMDYLDEHIGIAPANSQEELQAAELVADIMGDHGLEPVLEEFDSRPLAQAVPYVIGILLFILMIVQGVTGGAIHIVAVVLSLLLAASIIVRQYAFDLFEGFGPASGSQNVVAVHHAEGDRVVKGARPIVIVAHLDTPRESLLHGPLARMHNPLKQMFAPCAIVAVVTLIIQCLIFLPEPIRTFAWIVGIFALIPVLILSVVSLVDRHLPCTEGANDNKSSIAALLTIMDRVQPSPDRVSDGEAGARPHRRSADETELPVQSSTRIEVIEDVKGIRHGEDVLASLGILPSTCEIIYEEPKVRIIEEQIEINPFEDGFDEEVETVKAPVDESAADKEEILFDDVDDQTAEELTAATDEEGEDFEGEEEFEDEGEGRFSGLASIKIGIANRLASLRERIAARRERDLSEDEDEDAERPVGRHARQEDSEWFEDEDDADYIDDAEDDQYDEDEDVEAEDEEAEDEDDLAPLSADMVGSGRPGKHRKHMTPLVWDDEDEAEGDQAETAAAETDTADESEESVEADKSDEDDDFEDEDEYEDDYEDDDFESDEYDDDDYEDNEDDDYEDDYDDELEDEEDEEEFEDEEEPEPARSRRSAARHGDDEWIDWEEEDDAESEDYDDEEQDEEPYEDEAPKVGLFTRIKNSFRSLFSTPETDYAGDDFFDDDQENEDEDYEDEPHDEDEEPAEDDDFFDDEDDEEFDEEDDYDDEDDEYLDDEEEWDDYDESDDKETPSDKAVVADKADDDYEDDYDDDEDYEYDYNESDFDDKNPYNDVSAEPFNEPLSDPNELHFDREEDDDILPRDTTGLDTISDSYDLIDSTPKPQPHDTPTPIDDPNWGVSSFTPARPAVNIARRAALFDLPDPTFATPDPLRPDDDYDNGYEDYDDYDDYDDDDWDDDYEDDAEPYDYDDKVDNAQHDDTARGDWKGGATMRSDIVSDEGPLVIDAEDLKDAILELGDDFLVAHDIWFVVTGASAADHSGIKAFIEEHRRDVRGAFLVNLDSIGAGALGMYVREGLREPRRADRRIVNMLKGIASDLHIQLDTASMTWDETEAATPMRSRLRAVTLVGLDDTDQPALSHTKEDIPDNVNPKQVYDVVRIICELIRRS